MSGSRLPFSRRQLLHAMGLSSGSLFLPSLMTDKQAARAAENPRRLVIFYTQHGPGYENWKMRKPGLANTDQDWEFPLDSTPEAEWSPVLQPLYANRKDLLVLDGLAYTSVFTDKNFNPHNMGTAHALTGARVIVPGGFDNQGSGGAASIDQIAAQSVAVQGRIKSLFYSTAYKPWCISFMGPNQLTPAEGSPMLAFDRLFKGTTTTGGTTEADLIAKARLGVLDLVAREYAGLAPRLGTEDRQRLDKHRALVADLEAQIMGRASIMCNPPTRPTIGGGSGATGNDLARTNAFIPLVAAAMACDMTRVAVIDCGQLSGSNFGGTGNVHVDIAHEALAGKPASLQMANYYRVHAAQFSKLVTLFSEGGLLDTTALLWVSELSNGPHDMNQVLAVLAGNCGGAFRTGRYVKYKEDGANPALNGNFGGRSKLGPAHSKLLVSLLQAMGVDQNAMPVTSAKGSSALPGVPIDLTGPLPRLK